MVEKDGLIVPVTDPAELAEKRQFCHNRIPGWELDQDGRIQAGYQWRSGVGHAFMWNAPVRVQRSSPAQHRRIHRQTCPGRVQTAHCRRVHQFKSKSSDRGVAFHQLVTAAKWTLTLTGTFFGGKSHLDLLVAAPLEPRRAARLCLSR